MSEALIVAITEVGDCRLVMRKEWFQVMVEEESNPVPVTIRVKTGWPAVALDGLRDVICGIRVVICRTRVGGLKAQFDANSTIPLIAMIATQEIARPERIMKGRIALVQV